MTSDDATPPIDPPAASGAPATNGAARSNGRGRVDIGRVMREEPDRIAAAFERATKSARTESRITGIPLVFWRDGRCVWEDADGNEVPEPDWARRFRETGEKPPVLYRRAG